ncbi:MAG: N-acyl homoserine lactonase family protein [Chloroflexi bacterium]|nr:N-acyl homoserine lactonase family protein [Chloroflexota bacterium]
MKIHAIQTGTVLIKKSQLVGKGAGFARQLNILFDSEWVEPLPILAWVIEHPEGLIVVDTGETARAAESGYFPAWHPYYRMAVRLNVAPEEEIGPQLQKLGIQPADVKTVVLTHLHTDHADGLHHFPKSEIYVDGGELAAARTLLGRTLRGYIPHRWPDWFAPKFLEFNEKKAGPFEQVHRLTRAGDVLVLPTPGHTPNHVSVIARQDGVSYFLAGDASYSEQALLERKVDGISPDKAQALKTIDKIREYAVRERTVYLPSHDAESMSRLEKEIVST